MTTPSTALARGQKPTMLERLLDLAKTPEERTRAFDLAERYQQNQVVQAMMNEIANSSWGKNVSPVLRVEIARWAMNRTEPADPATEVEVLGGRPYLLAPYWMRLVAKDPDFVRAEEIWVHPDPRASAEVNAQRRDLRVQYAIPDEIAATVGLFREARAKAEKLPPIPIKAALLVILHFRNRGPFIGKKWSPSRASDDVGMDYPELSAYTRAWRKAALQAVRIDTTYSPRLATLIEAHRSSPIDGAPATEIAGVGQIKPGSGPGVAVGDANPDVRVSPQATLPLGEVYEREPGEE